MRKHQCAKSKMYCTGGDPYPAMVVDETFIKRLIEGYRMEKPSRSPEEV